MSRMRSLALIPLAVLVLGCPARRDEPKPEAKDDDQAGRIAVSEAGAGMEGKSGPRKVVGIVPALDDASIPWGGTVNTYWSADPSNINPVTYRDNTSAKHVRDLYPQLTKVHADDLTLYPWMAESLPEVSDDKRTYTWRIRRGVKWLLTGREVTTADYVSAWKKLSDPDVDAADKRATFERVEDVVAVDDHTFQVRMKEPYFAGVWIIGYHFYPIPHEIFDGMPAAEFNEHPIRREPMPYGLWQLEKWTRQVEFVFKRDDTNAHVFSAALADSNLKRPHVDRIRQVFIKDTVAAFEMLRAGEIDIMAISPDDWVAKTNDPAFEARFRKAEYYLPQWNYIGWNMRKPMFADLRVRKALTLLTRRQEIIDNVLHGYGRVINGPNFVFSRAYDDSYEPLPFDPAQAAALLAEAGWVDSDGDGWLDKDGQRFAFELMTSSGKSPHTEALQLALVEDGRKAGIEVTIRQLEWTTFLENVYDRKFDAVTLSWIPDPTYEDPYELWHSSQADLPRTANHAGYRNPEVDALVEAARLEFDDEKRYEMLRKVHRIVGQEYPLTWLWCGQSLVAVNKRWENVQVHTLGVRYTEWYLAEGGRSTPAIPD